MIQYGVGNWYIVTQGPSWVPERVTLVLCSLVFSELITLLEEGPGIVACMLFGKISLVIGEIM